MFPETEFHKLGSRLMLLVMNGKIYHTGNSEERSSNFLSLCGLNFPLIKGELLNESEERYTRRSKSEIEKFKAEKIGLLNDQYIKNLEQLLKQKEDAVFFFREICPGYDPLFRPTYISDPDFLRQSSAHETGQNQTSSGIFENLLCFNCAVINGRIYPLQSANSEVFVNLEGSNYELSRAVETIDDVEKEFQKRLADKLTEESAKEFERGKENEGIVSNLVREIGSLEVIRGIKKYQNCYEFGEIGYDFSAKLIYWIVIPHFNETTGRTYSEGQCAVTLEFENKKFGSSVKFAERDNRDCKFIIHPNSNCYGGATRMTSFEEGKNDSVDDKMYMLRTCAEMVFAQRKFYEPPITNSSEESNY